MLVAPVPEPEPKAVSNPWGRAGKPGSRRVAPPPAKPKKARCGRSSGGDVVKLHAGRYDVISGRQCALSS